MADVKYCPMRNSDHWEGHPTLQVCMRRWFETIGSFQIESLSKFRTQVVIQNVLRHWIQSAANKKINEENSENAFYHFQKELVRRKLNQWRNKLVLNIKADEFRDHLVVKYNLIKWIQKIKSIQRANVLYIQAAKYHNTKIIRNSFNQWNFETKKLQNLNQKLEIFKEKRLFITMKINIRNWRNETNRQLDRNYLYSIAIRMVLNLRNTSCQLGRDIFLKL